MKKLLLAVGLALALCAPAVAEEEKAVPRKDKGAGELVGTVLEVQDNGTSPCNGARIVTVWMSLRGVSTLLPGGIPAAAICPGGTVSQQCLAFRPGQRVRLKGRLEPTPAWIVLGLAPGEDACNPSSWDGFLPFHGFMVTSVLR